MMKRPAIVLVLLLGLPACMPHKAAFLTETAELKRADLRGNGVLAFTIQNEIPLGVEVDFVSQQSQQAYRVNFSPSFKRVTVSLSGLTPVELVSDSVAMFLLPAGTYRPKYMITTRTPAMGPTQQSSSRVNGPAFEIVAGKITSAGRLVVRGKSNLLFYSDLRVEQEPGAIDAEIRAVRDPVISQWPIVAAQLHIATD
jgi:hypothetical protein